MYSELLSSHNPGFLVILLDRSASMGQKYSDGSTKAEKAAQAVNKLIEEMLVECREGLIFKDRCHLLVIGYGSKVEVLLNGLMSSISKEKKVLASNDEEEDMWIEPQNSGTTPMHEAFQKAYAFVERWLETEQHKNCFPPIVINITDGEPDQMDLVYEQAQELKTLSSTDGNTIILNAHISTDSKNTEEKQNLLPSHSQQLSDDYEKFLFEISSILPEKLRNAAQKVNFLTEENSRGVVFNAQPHTLVKLLNFGTLAPLKAR